MNRIFSVIFFPSSKHLNTLKALLLVLGLLAPTPYAERFHKPFIINSFPALVLSLSKSRNFLVEKIKRTYKKLHKTHEIHVVDENDRIVLKEVDVSEFAVKLKIGCSSRPETSFRDEAKRYLENLKDIKGDTIDISNLIDNENRVTFLRGIAGMGKSVLVKQLTYGWANGEIYQNFKMCVMFECRDLNYFVENEGANLKKHEILSKFLKSKVNYDLGDGEGILVIVDGLDELFDITEKESIIDRLLSRRVAKCLKFC